MDAPQLATPLGGLPAWALQDAKAQFSEVVRAAREHGPQRVTLRGRDAVVVLSAAEYERLVPEPPSKSLWDLVQTLPRVDDEAMDDLMRIIDEGRVSSPVSPPIDFAA